MNIQTWEEFEGRNDFQIKWVEFENDEDAFAHATGRILLPWNLIEEMISGILSVSSLPSGVSQYIASRMHNADRLAILKLLGDEYVASDATCTELGKAYFSYIGTCADNRNFFAHCRYNDFKTGNYYLSKPIPSKPGKSDSIAIPLSALRTMSQDIENTLQFGGNFLSFLHAPNGKSIRLVKPPSQPIKWQKYKTE